MKKFLQFLFALGLTIAVLTPSLGQNQSVAKTNFCAPPEEICEGVGCEKRDPGEALKRGVMLLPNAKRWTSSGRLVV